MVAEKINIRQTFFFFDWATEWALKYHGPTRPVEPVGPDEGGFGPWKKNPFSKRAVSLGPRVESEYGKTRLKPDPLPFLFPTDGVKLMMLRSSVKMIVQ